MLFLPMLAPGGRSVSQNISNRPADSWWRNPRILTLACLMVGVLYPYLASLGGFPAIDEGSYAYISHVYALDILQQRPLTRLQGMSLWSLLVSGLTLLPGPTLIWLRLVDLGAALCFAWLFCRILFKEAGTLGLLLALVFLIAMTRPEIIDCGAKNSLFAAWACFALAWYMGRYQKPTRRTAWVLSGVLTCFGVLLREPLFPFALLGFFAMGIGRGFRASVAYALGGLGAGIIVLGCIELLLPGSLADFYMGYTHRTLVYAIQAYFIWPHFWHYLLKAFVLFFACPGGQRDSHRMRLDGRRETTAFNDPLLACGLPAPSL